MIKQQQLAIALLLGALLSGCGQPAPALDGSSNVAPTGLGGLGGETVTIDEAGGAYGSTSEDGASSISDGTPYNSSTEGLKSIYFGFDNYTVSSKMENRIYSNATHVRTRGLRKVKVEGNCDEFGTDEYNYALGLKRAKAVKDRMVAQGVSADSMVIVSLGESNPSCSQPTDGCYEQNRRVDLHPLR